jgi:hypothetical protein
MKKKSKEQKLQFTQDLDQFRVKLKVDPAATTFYKKHHVYTVTGLPPNSGTASKVSPPLVDPRHCRTCLTCPCVCVRNSPARVPQTGRRDPAPTDARASGIRTPARPRPRSAQRQGGRPSSSHG